MIKGSINSIESMGLVDGPGIRTVVFLNGCNKRCKYCHNPEMFNLTKNNITPEELVKKILRNKSYFGNNGGVTFSGGEPLLQLDFLIECCKLLKKQKIHIALDTSGLKIDYKDLFKYIDLILLDIKHTNKEEYEELVKAKYEDFEYFLNHINKLNIKIWIRQVIVPDVNDNKEYINNLAQYLKNIKNIDKINFLPFHNSAKEKYKKLKLNYEYENKPNMDIDKCKLLYDEFKKML